MVENTTIYKSNSLTLDVFTYIHRVRRHIEQENCSHCKSILNNVNNEAGANKPAPAEAQTATQISQPTKNGMNLSK